MRQVQGATATAAMPVAERKALAKEDLAVLSEMARQQFMTPGDTKSAVYRQKKEEAEAYLAAGAPIPEDYPFLKARAELLDPVTPDYAAVAAEWKARADAWLIAGPAIETVYDNAILLIDGAATVAEIETILAGIVWPAPA